MTQLLATDPQRSALMARVRQKETSAEKVVGRTLKELGAGYRKNVRALPGSPDFANRSRGWAIFVHGCFWHQHVGCARATIPKRNRAFWEAKFAANRIRDARAVSALRHAGFRVTTIWECQVSDSGAVRARLSKLLKSSGVKVR